MTAQWDAIQEWNAQHPDVGNDKTLDLGDGSDTVYDNDDYTNFWGNGGNDWLFGQGGDDRIDGMAGNDHLYGGSANDLIFGGAGTNELFGQEGDDLLVGEGTNSTVTGGAGNDLLLGFWNGTAASVNTTASFIDGSSTLFVDLRVANVDTDLGYSTSASLGNDKIGGITNVVGGYYNDTIFGNSLNNVITGVGGGDELWGVEGNDTIFGDDGNDTLAGWTGADEMHGGYNNDLLRGENEDDRLYGDQGNDTIQGDEGNDTAHGGTDQDRIYGYNGNDSLLGDEGNDTISGENDQDTIQGQAGNDSLYGDAGNDLVFGGADNDQIYGYWGTDNLFGEAGNDTIFGENEADAISGGADNDQINAGAGNDQVNGDSGNDTLDGGADGDMLRGGTGDDLYLLYDVTGGSYDNAVELGNAGLDTVYVLQVSGGPASYTLAAEVEQGVIRGADANQFTLFGNGLDNALYDDVGDNILSGGIGNDTLNGGGGTDVLDGGAGNDRYFLQDRNGDYDLVVESANGGYDFIYVTPIHDASFLDQYIMSGNVEYGELLGAINFNLFGNSIDNTLIGNSGANVIFGYSGNDKLNGSAGYDTLNGGDGNDTYILNDGFDFVNGQLSRFGFDPLQESANSGIDTVVVSEQRGQDGNFATYYLLTYTLPDNVENGTVTDTANYNQNGVNFPTGTTYFEITGNALGNALTGNSVANRLFGLGGNDNLYGGAGSDTLDGGTGFDYARYDNANYGNLVISLANPAANTGAAAGDTYTGIEGVVGGAGNDAITGDGSANIVLGQGGNDTLSGGPGNDTMYGGSENDVMIVTTAGDAVVENAAQGSDTVQSYISYALGANVENLSLITAAAMNGFGNDLANIILANQAGAANNYLNGGLGSDTITGGAGQDTFVFSTALGTANIDKVTDYSVADDAIRLDDAIFSGIGAAGTTLATALFHKGAAAADGDDRIIYDASGALFYDKDGLGGVAQVKFAQLAAGLALTNADFLIF